jgi:hypothetical protein
MCFEQLHDSQQRGELLLIAGGMCHWHLRRDGQLTIREILSNRPGAGTAMLETLRRTPGATRIVAKCPADLPANAWYARRGFIVTATEQSKTGREINVWTLDLSASPSSAAQSSPSCSLCGG